jgi:hypothetical protein
MGLPILGMTQFLDPENFFPVGLPRLKVGIAGFELEINSFSAGLAFVVLEFNLAVNASTRVQVMEK